MLFNLLFSFLSISQNATNITYGDDILGDRGCGLGSQDIFFINSQDDINVVKNCQTINGSLFINGDYNVDSLTELNSVEYITGYLVIYDSHTLKSLKGLENIKEIYALNPYLLDYGVTIKYNNNEEDNTTGLCFANNVIWGRLTSQDIIVSNNRDDCPECHSECIGCFGPGRLLCQECINYRSGSACVENCPTGTVLDNGICNEFFPVENINLNFERLTYLENGLNITWSAPTTPNGFILEYVLLRNGNAVYRSYYNNDGYYSNDELYPQFIDTLPFFDRNYTYQIAYSNSKGTTISTNQNYFMVNRIPHDITYFIMRGVRNTTANLFWFYNDSSLTPTFEYNLNGSEYIEIPQNYSYIRADNGYTRYLHFIDNLLPFTTYNINIRARYNNGNIGDITPRTFTTLVGRPPNPPVPFVIDRTLYWNETSDSSGPILFYLVWMNDTEIYNGSYLSEGIDLSSLIDLENTYDFMITAYTSWNLYSNSQRSLFYFFGIETTTTINPPFVPTGDLENWEISLIIVCLVLITIISLSFFVCGYKKLQEENQETTPNIQRAIYNTRYEDVSRSNSISVKRNNIVVDEFIGRNISNPVYVHPERGPAIKNTFYGELNSILNYEDEEEEVLGFNDTESVDYLCIIDQTVSLPEKTTSNIRPIPKPRRRSVQSNKVVPPPPLQPNLEKIINPSSTDTSIKKNKNYQNTAKRKMSLLEELKLKVPELAPKNMMLE